MKKSAIVFLAIIIPTGPAIATIGGQRVCSDASGEFVMEDYTPDDIDSLGKLYSVDGKSEEHYSAL